MACANTSNRCQSDEELSLVVSMSGERNLQKLIKLYRVPHAPAAPASTSAREVVLGTAARVPCFTAVSDAGKDR